MQSLDIRRTVRLAYYELVAAPAGCRSRRSCAASPNGRATRRAIDSSPARRHGSKRCRRSSRWRRRTTSRKRRAGGSRPLGRHLNTALGRGPDVPAEPADAFDAGVIPAGSRGNRCGEPRHRRTRPRNRRGGRPRAAGNRDAPAGSDDVRRCCCSTRARSSRTAGGRRCCRRSGVHPAQRGSAGRDRAGRAAARACARRGSRRSRATRPRRRRGRRRRAGSTSAIATRSCRSSRTIESMAEDSYRSGQTNLAAFLQALQAAREVRLRATDAGPRVPDGARGSRARPRRTDSMMQRGEASRWRRRRGLTGCHAASPDETVTETAVAVEVEAARTADPRGRSPRRAFVTAPPGGELVVTAPEAARIVELPKAEGDRVTAGRCARALRNSVADRGCGVEPGRHRTGARRGSRMQRPRRRAWPACSSAASRRARKSKTRERELREAQAALAQAQSASGAATTLAGRLVVRARFAGVVAKRWHNPGDLRGAGAIRSDSADHRPDAPRGHRRRAGRRRLARITAGAPARIVNPAGGEPIDASVISRPAAVDAGSVTARGAAASALPRRS